MITDEIIETQNNLMYSIKYYQDTFLYTFNKIINNKTGQLFINKFINNYYIFNFNNFDIVYSSTDNIWILYNNSIIIYNHPNLIEIINQYLLINNRLSLCLHVQSMDTDMEELNNILKNINL